MSKTIDIVAQAIFQLSPNEVSRPSRLAAERAIAALREPTEAMITAGWAAAYDSGEYLPADARIAAVWRRMIDAALTD